MVSNLITVLAFPLPTVYSDSLIGGGTLTQRIGNFDVELKTVPAKPLAGDNTQVFIRIGSINGDDVVDTPITIKITKQGREIHRTNTIVVPYGHYSYSFNFAESGIYAIDILIQDKIYGTGLLQPQQTQGILFTFPIDVRSKAFFGFFDFQTMLMITVVVVIVVIVSSIIFYSMKKQEREKKSYHSSEKTW
jgi:hypothetical protein